jgi:methionine synthase I (cobalamin-dependent)
MGTRLVARGLDLARDDAALWNLTRPQEVRAVHQGDVDAGAEALVTNTFGASRQNLARLGQETAVGAICHAAVRIARDVAGPDRLVLGSVGPTATLALADFREPAEALVAAGVDGLVLETQSVSGILERLSEAVVAAAGVPVVVSAFDWPETPELERVASELVARGAHALGFNCESDLSKIVAWAERLRRTTEVPLFLKPSAGLPGEPAHAPSVFAEFADRVRGLGPVLLGGCCGTTEAHVRAIRTAIDQSTRKDPVSNSHANLVQ